MQNDTSKFLVNIIPLQNVQTNVSGTNDVTSLSNSVVAIQQMINTDTRTIRTNNLGSFSVGQNINVTSGLNLCNVGITSNGQAYGGNTSVNTIVYSTITAASGTFDTCYAKQFITLDTEKTGIREWTSPVLEDLGKIHPYIYTVGGSEEIGLIAQEVKGVLPQLVNDYVNYNGVVSLLIKAVQELGARVSTLESLG